MNPHEPEPLPLADLNIASLVSLVGEANAALASYDGRLRSLVNPRVLLSPLTTQEAVMSSRIEGTQATMAEVLEFEAGQYYEEREQRDIQEVINYRSAMDLGAREIADRPLRLTMIRNLHRSLMTGVRGQEKTPGEFRREQNWLGPRNCQIEDATFVPPTPLRLRDSLDHFERYLEYEDFDPIAQAGIAHAQFELLHPFNDGNGRVGRLLIPLFLARTGRLHAPMFYISAYLEQHRDEYYERLQAISAHRNWLEWLTFFLKAIIHQANLNTDRVDQIQALHNRMMDEVREITHSQYTGTLVTALFDRTFFTVNQIVQHGIPDQVAYLLLRQLRKRGIIRVIRKASGRRPAIFSFPELVNIAEGYKILPEREHMDRP